MQLKPVPVLSDALKNTFPYKWILIFLFISNFNKFLSILVGFQHNANGTKAVSVSHGVGDGFGVL